MLDVPSIHGNTFKIEKIVAYRDCKSSYFAAFEYPNIGIGQKIASCLFKFLLFFQ